MRHSEGQWVLHEGCAYSELISIKLFGIVWPHRSAKKASIEQSIPPENNMPRREMGLLESEVSGGRDWVEINSPCILRSTEVVTGNI
jgi:hypothetical protein